jgi:hypothetical protein
MAVNVSKTKCITYFPHQRQTSWPNIKIYDDNEPGLHEKDKIFELERIHNSHVSPDLRLYKLLGIHLDETLLFDNQT